MEKKIKIIKIICVSIALLLGLSDVLAQNFPVTSSSFVGDLTDVDEVRGTRIQSDGTIVLGAIITTSPGGVNPTLLNGATSGSAGTIIRLTAGGTIISVTKVGSSIVDLALDENDNIYAALGSGGFVKLNPTASSLIYQKTNGGSAIRLDASGSGTVAALNGNGSNRGTIFVYDANGNEIINFYGMHYTQDVAVDAGLQRVFSLGFRNAHSGCNPVQIAYLRAHDFTGAEVWQNYNHSANLLDDCNAGVNENNMADTRGYRVSIGEDGILYAAFEVAGGNHIFRRDPNDLSVGVTVVKGDKYHDFYNTKAEHKTFFARYNPNNGAYLLGQQFVARLNDGSGNAVRVISGDIQADVNGRVYIGGYAAYGLPLTFAPAEAGTYTGGAWLMVMSSDFTERLLVSRIAQGKTFSIGIKTINGSTNLAWGGETKTEFYTKNAFQSSMAGGTLDGFYGSSQSSETSSNAAPTVSITSPTNNASFEAGSTITIQASAADSDGSISKVEFYRGSTKLGEDTTSPYSYSWSNVTEGSYSLTARATDNEGASTTSAAVNITVETVSARDAFSQMEGESLDGHQGLTVSTTHFGYFDSGDWARYDNVDFGSGAASVDIHLAVDNAAAGKTIELRTGGPTGTLIGSHVVQGTGGWYSFQTQTVKVDVSGVHDLYLVGAGGGSSIANIDWFKFNSAGTPQESFAVKVNFQPEGYSTPSGFVGDEGAVYGSRNNGYTYGWDQSNTNTRDRNVSGISPEGNTLNHMNYSSSFRTWEIEVPNGDYILSILAGDASYVDQINSFDIEGVVVNDPDGQDNFDEYTNINVTVSDGRLTIKQSSNGSNAKINFVDIKSAPSDSEDVLVKVNFQPEGYSTPTGFIADEGAVYGDRNNGYTYGWDQSNTNTRDRNVAGVSPEGNTLNHLSHSSSFRTWEMEVPNGDYLVSILAGDASYTDQINSFDIEGTVVNDPDGQDNFDEFTNVAVTVSDGRLTISQASTGSNAKLCYVEVNSSTSSSRIGGEENMVNNEEDLKSPQFLLYPNPITEGSFTIIVPIEQEGLVVIYDMLGKKLIEKKVRSGELIELGEAPKGMYNVVLKTKDSNTARKILIK